MPKLYLESKSTINSLSFPIYFYSNQGWKIKKIDFSMIFIKKVFRFERFLILLLKISNYEK